MSKSTTPMTDIPVIRNGSKEPRVDARLLAKELRNKYKSVSVLIERYKAKFKEFGHMTFEMSRGSRKQGGGTPEKVYLLNEDQAFFLLSLSRNSDHVLSIQ